MASNANPTGTATAVNSDVIDVPRLHRRLCTYASAYGLPPIALAQLESLLATPLAQRLLALPPDRLRSNHLVNDAYKPRMHVMYDRYMTGVSAEFALVVRRAPPAADPATLPHTRPALWAGFQAAAAELRRIEPYGPFEVEALRTQFGLELPAMLLERCRVDGVAPVTWERTGLQQQQHEREQEEEQDGPRSSSGSGSCSNAGRVAIASGPLVSASLVETSLMQRFQELAVAAQAEALASSSASSSSFPSPSCAAPLMARPDRTERLASSLVKLALTVERINGLRHGLRTALFAGRRASGLLFLVLQNLYCAAHLDGYAGTSSLFAAATVCREWADMHLPERERWGGPGRLVGTHAHEQSSALQQLLAPYDREAGRRCGLPHPVALSPLLAHLLFLAANGAGGPGGSGATALADTFTTAAFLAVARATSVPAAFRRDVEAEHGWVVAEGARCFDLFRVWRLDSGCYEAVAEAIVEAWEERCEELRAEERPELPRPQLMHSNLESVEHIAKVCALDPRVRPATLAFGTLADGFLPFLPPPGNDDNEAGGGAQVGREDGGGAAAQGQQAGGVGGRVGPESADAETHANAPAGPPPPQQQAESERPTIVLASVVMKLVQARPPRPLPQLCPEPTTPTGTDAAASSELFSPKAPPPPLPECAVKLGDGNSSGKTQVDPRLPPAVAQRALRAAEEMARGSATSPLDEPVLSAILSEAYEALTRDGVLMA